MTDTTPAPLPAERLAQAPIISPAIRAQNPDLDTAWATIAWWEQTCDYWRAEAQKGYALRDSLAAEPEPEWRLRAENGATIRTDAETARNAMTKGTYSIDGSPIAAALTRPGPDDEWAEADLTRTT
jgi:hypothetical protein